MVPSQMDIEEEQRHFAEVVMTFRYYARYALSANNRRRKDMYRLPQADLDLVRSLRYREKLEFVDRAILENAHFFFRIVENPEIFGHDIDFDQYRDDEGQRADGGEKSDDSGLRTRKESSDVPGAHETKIKGKGPDSDSGNDTTGGIKGSEGVRDPGQNHSHSHSQGAHTHSPSHSHGHDRHRHRKIFKPSESDMDKLRSTLKQFVRDWSAEGKPERDACYGPIKQALLDYFKDAKPENRSQIRVLVPGAGLGRLAFDVARLGFACQGNEFSHYMLLASHFILNQTSEINQHRIYPYIHSFSNASSRNDILRPILIPDVIPSDLPPGSPFSLVAGDFEDVYGGGAGPEEPQHGLWDAVLTCFFIDTSKNIVNYLKIIHNILAPGGVWINLGPLLWHWENNTSGDISIELDLEEVKELAKKVGFELTNERMIDTTYTNNAQGMLSYTYHTAFWTATKLKAEVKVC